MAEQSVGFGLKRVFKSGHWAVLSDVAGGRSPHWVRSSGFAWAAIHGARFDAIAHQIFACTVGINAGQNFRFGGKFTSFDSSNKLAFAELGIF